MKFPYSMLRDYVDTSLDADGVGDLLTMAGFELESIEEVEGDKVLDIKVVSNRGDGLSVFGLAREILAKDTAARPTDLYMRGVRRFGAEMPTATQRTYHWEAKDLPRLQKVAPKTGRVSVTIETEDCTRYACLLFEGVSNGESPEWMQRRLRQSGQRAISLLVDVTNYVMLELGQPLHAFDSNKLAGPAIVVRNARQGEKLTTLDGVEHELNPSQMMICDAERPVAAAGIMGGLDTEVDDTTRNVLLESAHFVNTSVRRTRKQLELSTEASYRFERSVDPDGVVAALERFAELLGQIDGGSSRIEGLIDVYPAPATRDPIHLDLVRSDTLLGMHIPEEDALGYLDRLGFSVVKAGGQLTVTPPTWRPDVVREEDLVEELGRVHGFEQIPEALPSGTTIRGGTSGFEAWLDKVREACVRAGFVQTISHSLRDRGPLDEPGAEGIQLRNPNSAEMSWLRSSVLPSLADNAKRNGAKDLHLFEIGRVFRSYEGSPMESIAMAIWTQGAIRYPDWSNKDPECACFYTLKATLEELFREGGVDIEFQPGGDDPRFHPTRQAMLMHAHEVYGAAGQIHPDVAEELDLPADTFFGEMRLDRLYEQHATGPKLKPISRNPAVRRDIALLIDKSVPFAAIDESLKASIGDVMEKRWVFDVYEGKGIPEGKHSLAIALQLRKHGSNFTDEEANQVREKAVEALAALGGTPR